MSISGYLELSTKSIYIFMFLFQLNVFGLSDFSLFPYVFTLSGAVGMFCSIAWHILYASRC